MKELFEAGYAIVVESAYGDEVMETMEEVLDMLEEYSVELEEVDHEAKTARFSVDVFTGDDWDEEL